MDDARISRTYPAYKLLIYAGEKHGEAGMKPYPKPAVASWFVRISSINNVFPKHKGLTTNQGIGRDSSPIKSTLMGNPNISPIFRGYLWVKIPNSPLERSGQVENYDFLSPLNPPALSFNNRRACCQCCCQMVWQAATSPRIKACISRRCPNCAFRKSPPEIRISISFSHRRP